MPMVKSFKKVSFVREFTIEKQAEKFAREKQGKVQVFYDWDSMENRIIKTYRVKY